MRFLEELSVQEYGSKVYEALLISAIVFYARPFSRNEKNDSPHPSEPRIPDVVLAGLEDEERKLHEKIIKLRNKAIAHAEWSYHPAGVTDNGVIKAMPYSIWRDFKENSEVVMFKNLVAKVSLCAQHEQANESRKYSNRNQKIESD